MFPFTSSTIKDSFTADARPPAFLSPSKQPHHLSSTGPIYVDPTGKILQAMPDYSLPNEYSKFASYNDIYSWHGMQDWLVNMIDNRYYTDIDWNNRSTINELTNIYFYQKDIVISENDYGHHMTKIIDKDISYGWYPAEPVGSSTIVQKRI